MKPLSSTEASELIEAIYNGEGCEIKSLNIVDSATMSMTLGVQDKRRENDWIDLELYFYEVFAAKLLNDEQLPRLSTENGFSLVFDGERILFAFDRIASFNDTLEQEFYIVCKDVKYDEKPFS